MNKDPNSLRNQYELMKEKYLRDKYIIAAAGFQLATQICVCYLLSYVYKKRIFLGSIN